MIEKINFLFKLVPDEIRSRLLLDKEALYSTTDQVTANKIAKEVSQYIGVDSIITDATACIGGSTLAFSQVFQFVNAIEFDETRFKYLQENVATLGLTNVKCIYGDALNECVNLKQDAIFLDCPWGGPKYKEAKTVMLYLSELPLYDVLRQLKDTAKIFILKIPINFDEELFIEKTQDVFKIETKIKLRKMNLLIVTTCVE